MSGRLHIHWDDADALLMGTDEGENGFGSLAVDERLKRAQQPNR
jgi:hypothetical protein